MNTIYESKKRLTSVMTASKHTLALLMSKLRVSLEAAWSMARVWLEYAYSIFITRLRLTHNEITSRPSRDYVSFSARLRLVFSEITSRFQRDYVSFSARLRLVVSLLLMLILGSGNVWGQDDYSGVYYLGNGNGYNAENVANNFYLFPATNADYTTDQPHLTTYKSGHVDNSCWYVIKNGAYYNIIHAADGKYLAANPAYDGTSGNNVGRLRVHLEAMDTPDNSTLFEIKLNKNGGYNIRHKDMADKINNSTTTYLDPAGGNRDGTDLTNYRTMDTSSGTVNVGGGIGYWTDEAAARWYFENALSIDPPTITNNDDGTFTITTETGATIYYTTDGSTPTTSSYAGTGTTSVNVNQTESLTVIKAIAKATSDPFPTIAATYNLPVCERPVISVSGGNVSITCATEGAVIHYTTDGSSATSSSPIYTGPFAKGSASEVRAIATKAGYIISSEAALLPPTEVSSSSQITDMTGNYILSSSFSSDTSIGTSDNPFRGTIDGNMVILSGLSHPFVAYANGAIIRNVILDNVSISGNDNGNAGAICGEATGDTRIYNCGVLATESTVNTDKNGYTYLTDCSSSVSGSNYVGGIVGLLDGSARVINCFSYANVSGGNYAGGIVGYNKVATKSNNLKTMVMNCMFYGEVSGSSQAPIYNGSIITNRGDQSGVSNFNYFWAGASYVQNSEIDVYNCALSAETRFLQRFEFFRHILNSNRELAAWWATGSMENKEEIMKWVLEPSQIGSSTPYPILKTPGQYPSVVNIDADHAEAFAVDAATKKTQYNQGRKFGTLTINIQNASSGAPDGANIIVHSVTPNITDKDPAHFNFNYYKVQLPYYNDVGTKNYTGNKVVTGWEVTVSGGTHEFSDLSSDASASVDEAGDITLTTPFNFADRKSTQKDNYANSGRIFSQGAYFDVPEGVTSITIKPHWANCVYVSDEYPDVVYNQGMTTAASVATVGGGQRYTNGDLYDINGSSQNVYTTMASAVTALNPSGSVYDNAIVLVGNVHSLSLSNETKTKPYTIMSIDLDKDNEPDYSYILRFDSRKRVHPVRIDFLNVIGLGMAQKSNGGTGTYNFGIMQPYGWFECTNTGLFRVTQFEYDPYDSRTSTTARMESPIILQGGVIEQWVTIGGAEEYYEEAKSVTYYHIGGNVWFKEFHIGVHQDKTQIKFVSKHPPISVTGGDYDIFYLTGYYNSPNNNYDDNAECYINGGRFNKVAGTGMQGIGNLETHANGNITWQIDNADINEFYGGGINAAHIAEGNIMTVISNSRVDQFCGGPKFGDMNSNKKVVTNATNCIFRTFFGAGYGGNSYNRRYPANKNNVQNIGWNDWVSEQYTKKYDSKYGGVETRIDYQFIPMSGNASNVARLFVDYVSFSLATTRDVTSKLTDCTITTNSLGNLDLFSQCVGNFYGGGNLGMVDGPVKSILTNCTVEGSVFGAGYSASLPPVAVMNNGFQTPPSYDSNLGAYLEAVMPSTETYTWQHRDVVNSTETAIDNGNHILYTTANLTTLGAVTGKATLTINGTTTVGKSVYGGGEESGVAGDTEVNVTRGTIGSQGQGGVEYGNVYGGGKGKVGDKVAGYVKGNTTVNISQASAEEPTTIYHNVYGGGAYGSVGNFTYDPTSGMPTSCAENTGSCTVNIQSGTFGWNGKENGMVFGSSRGDVATPEGDPAVDPNDRMAWVYSTHVTIGDAGAATSPTIKGSVYGSGENGHTFQNTIVDINKGIVGITDTDGGAAYAYRGNVYGGGCGTDKYDSDGDGIKDAYNPQAGIVKGTTTVNITGGHVVHNVYGAGAMGSVGGGADATSGKTTINISGGRIGYDGDGNGHIFGAARGEYGVSTAASGLANVRETAVNIDYTTTPAADNEDKNVHLIAGSVFGGGEAGTVKESVAVNMTGGLILKDLYGGGALADTQTDNWDATANENAGGWADAEKKSTLHTTTVRLTGGRVGEEVFGGGLGEAGKPAYVWGDVLVDLNGTTIEDNGTSPISTSSKGCIVNQVFGCNNVNGSPRGDVLVHVHATQNGDASKTNIAAKFAKDNEDLEQGESSDADYIAKLKRILADKIVIADKVSIEVAEYQAVLDNDDATVTALKTALTNIIAAISAKTSDDDMMKIISGTKYDVNAVYGGGNQAAYEPVGPNPNATDDDGKNTTNSTKVIIDGCGLTSIQTVYGGGNAASTPATETTVNGTYEIYELFGGGNGKDKLPSGADNPGANVGFYDYSAVESTYDTKEERQQSDFVNNYVYGTGKATVNIFGGTIWRVFGGSNTKGNVRQTALTMLDEGTACPFCVEEAYGGGKSAEMDAEAQLLMACIPGLEAVYGGAEAADVHGNVTLNITNGTFDRVFGGNNKSGTIGGSITINVEEIGCRPVKIGELYGGGNLAGYSVYGYDSDSKPKESGTTRLYNDPQINVMSFTSIGDIYGGGYGETAVMVGNPTVNVNEAYGKYYDKDESIVGENAKTPNNYPIPSHAKGKMGAISNVFGGGNAAKVIGNTTVNIATLDVVYVVKQVTVGETVSGLYTRSGAGTTASPFVYTATASTDVAVDGTTYYEKLDVQGVDIRGNVYGGGNHAEVTGNGNVSIGKRVE